MHFRLFFLLLLLHFSWGLKQQESTTQSFNTTDPNHSILMAEKITIEPKCQSECGNLTVPYPFGIASEGLSCSIDSSFDITCNNSFNPPKAFIPYTEIQVYDISNTELRVSTFVSYRCYDESGEVSTKKSQIVSLPGTSYLYSDANVLTVVGCDDFASIYKDPESLSRKGCMTTCDNAEDVNKDECSGNGCCQTSVNLDKYFSVGLSSDFNHTYNVSSFNPCGYAFLGEKDTFKFRGTSDLNDPDFLNRTEANVHIVLDWVIGNKTCTQALEDPASYACKHENSDCINATQSSGYRCSCKPGYKGNPYISPGCEDINECDQPTHGCEQHCNNTRGSFNCYCGPGYSIDGDGKRCQDINECDQPTHGCQQQCKNTQGSFNCYCGSGFSIDVRDDKKCTANGSKSYRIKLVLGMVICCLLVIIGMNWLYCIMKQRKHSLLRDKFFEQNGGFLLRQQSISEGGSVESTKHFTYEELKKATNNYAADRIVGEGGYGVVYKGILPDQRIIAVKRSRVLDTSQIHQFINEVVILAQVNHRNVVKLLGCCLECEVPLLVYEFVSNGTLFHHVHSTDGGLSWLSLDNRLRVAAESAGALAYLHSAASMPIMHRDVKLANILLDDNYVAKISDFGASRLVPMDKTKVITLVQGTLGYLDPEYFHTGELTDKSDVYSFGVVLAELLTGRKPICMENSVEEKNITTYFISSLKENKLFQVLDRRVVREGRMDQLHNAAQLVKRCLNLKGEERPTMKEVAMEIENLRKFTKHPWANEHGTEETTGMIVHTDIQHSDLYEIELSTRDGNNSEQYSSSTVSLLHQATSPR